MQEYWNFKSKEELAVAKAGLISKGLILENDEGKVRLTSEGFARARGRWLELEGEDKLLFTSFFLDILHRIDRGK